MDPEQEHVPAKMSVPEPVMSEPSDQGNELGEISIPAGILVELDEEYNYHFYQPEVLNVTSFICPLVLTPQLNQVKNSCVCSSERRIQ